MKAAANGDGASPAISLSLAPESSIVVFITMSCATDVAWRAGEWVYWQTCRPLPLLAASWLATSRIL